MKLVIGWGNALRGDDAIGLEVVRLLDENIDLRSEAVKLIAAHQLLPEMCEEISRADHVFFVDADRSLAPGVVQCLELPGAALETKFGSEQSLTHHMSPQALLDYARYLYGRAPAATVTAVGGAEYDCHSHITLTEQARAGAMEAERLIAARLRVRA